MKLSQYRAEHGVSVAAMAIAVGVTEVSIYRYERDRIPDPDAMAALVRVTRGAVTPNDFYNLPEAAA